LTFSKTWITRPGDPRAAATRHRFDVVKMRTREVFEAELLSQPGVVG
jgi:hypothetical protein